MIREIFFCCLAVGILNAASFEDDLADKISARTYSLANKKVKNDYQKNKKQLRDQVSVAPQFDKTDLSPFQIRVGNHEVFDGYGFDYWGNRVSRYHVEFMYASNIEQVIDYYLKNPNLPLTAEQKDPSRVFAAPQPDPKRSGYDYTGVENGYAAIISRALPSGYDIQNDQVDGKSASEILIKALLWNVFSSERAIALYNDVIMQMGEEDPEEQKKAYEEMAKDLGLKSWSEEEKREEKKRIKKASRKKVQEIKIFLGMV